MKKIIYVISMVFFLKVSFAEWVPEKMFNPYVEVKDVIKTPYFICAKPYTGGKLKVLVIGPAWGQRESVELMQRFDMEIEVIMTHTHSLLSLDNTYGNPSFWTVSKVIEEFDKKLSKKYDVIVIGDLIWDKIITNHRYEILRKIYEEGTGFVYINPPAGNNELNQLFNKNVLEDISVLTNGIPIEELPAFQGRDLKKVIKAGNFGKGRWISLNYKTGSINQILTPDLSSYNNTWEYEYYISLVGKNILWAGKRGCGIKLHNTTKECNIEDISKGIEVMVENKTDKRDFSIEGSVCCLSDNRIIPIDDIKIPDFVGEMPLKIKLPNILEGRYIVNLIFYSNKEVYDWISFPVEIQSSYKIENIELTKEFLRADENLSGCINFNKPLEEGYTVELNFYDNFGRLLWKKSYIGGEQAKIDFNFKVGVPYKSYVHYIEAILKGGDRVISSKRASVYISGREIPAFPCSIWAESITGSPNDYISQKMLERHFNLGTDAIFVTLQLTDNIDRKKLLAKVNLFGQPSFPNYSGREKSQGEYGTIHKDCLHNPEVIRENEDKSEKIGEIWEGNALVYGDGSDRSLGGNCYCAFSITEFRKWLKDRYKEITNLNKVWQTNYKNWEDIIPDTLEKAKEKNNYIGWVEFTRFMEESYVNYINKMKIALQKGDTEALIGVDGYGRLDSSDGADWWKLLGVVGFYNLYTYQDPPQLEITRSLSKYFPNVKYKTIYWGTYTGQFENEVFMKYFPWYCLLHDYNGVYWWTADGKKGYAGSNGSVIAPDLRMTYPYYLSKQGIEKIKGGIYQLFEGANRYNNGIAILYSKTSIHSSTAFSSPSRYVTSCSTFEKILEDMGYQYDYISSEQLEEGILKNFKVLILPYILALSEKEAKEIKAFVEAGGILISDEIPGQYDYYLRNANNGSLIGEIISKKGEIYKVKKGISFIFDSPISSYVKERQTEKGKEIRGKLYEILIGKEIFPITKLSGYEENVGIPLVEVVRYDKGNMQIISFINYREQEVVFNIENKKPIIYEVIENKLYMDEGIIPVKIDKGGVKIFVLLDTKITGLEINSSNEAIGGESFIFEVNLQTSENIKFPVCFRYSFKNQADEKSIYCGVIKGEKNSAKGIIPVALNDKKGIWVLEITDCISGITETKKISLR